MTEKKKCEYLEKDKNGNYGCGKRAPCDEYFDDLMACPAVHKIEPEELPEPYKVKFVDVTKKRKINPGWMR